RHQLRRAGQGPLRLAQQPAHELAEVRRFGSGPLGSGCGLAGDGEDRALAGVVQGFVQLMRAPTERAGNVTRGGLLMLADGFREAHQEMREHHPGIAPGTQNGGASRGAGGLGKRGVTEGAERIGDGSKREAEVGPGVAVRYREDVYAVDFVAAGGYPVGRGEERTGEPRPIEVGDPDRHGQATRRRPGPGPRREHRDAAALLRYESPAP